MGSIMKKCFLLSLILLSPLVLFAQGKANTRINNSEKTTLKLSNNIGKMSVQIGKMDDKIIDTQKIQSKNYNNTLNIIR